MSDAPVTHAELQTALAPIHDELVLQRDAITGTRTDLRQQLAETRNDLRQQMVDAQAGLRQQIADARTKLDEKIDHARAELNKEIADARVELDKKIDESRTELDAKIDTLRQEMGDMRIELRQEMGVMRIEMGEIRIDLTRQARQITDTRDELIRYIGEAAGHVANVIAENTRSQIAALDDKYRDTPRGVDTLRGELETHVADSAVHVKPSTPRPRARARRTRRS